MNAFQLPKYTQILPFSGLPARRPRHLREPPARPPRVAAGQEDAVHDRGHVSGNIIKPLLKSK